MPKIYAVFLGSEPPYPPEAQASGCQRFQVAGAFVDADSEPTTAEVEAFVALGGDPLAARVDAERDRRFGLGATVTVGSVSFPVDIDARGQRNLTGLAVVAGLPGASSFPFRDRANGMHTLAPADMVAVALQAFARVTAIYEASWALKDTSPIPADFAADSHWPSP